MSILIGFLIVGTLSYFIAGNKVSRPGSGDERISQWKAAIYAAKERPFFGYGYLNFELYTAIIKERYQVDHAYFRGHAHNNFFEMIGSTGIIGFLTFCLWLGFWIYEEWQKKTMLSNLALGLIIVFVVGGLTQSTISLGINLFFIMGVYPIFNLIGFKKSFEMKEE